MSREDGCYCPVHGQTAAVGLEAWRPTTAVMPTPGEWDAVIEQRDALLADLDRTRTNTAHALEETARLAERFKDERDAARVEVEALKARLGED